MYSQKDAATLYFIEFPREHITHLVCAEQHKVKQCLYDQSN